MYRIGATPAQVDAQRKADEAKAALLKQFDRFAFVVDTGALEIASGSLLQAGNPVLAKAMRDSIPRLRRGVDNVLAGTTSLDAWTKSVNGLISQVRAEAPSFSATSLISSSESMIAAAKFAVQAVGDLALTASDAAGKVVVSAGKTAGKTVKAAAEGAGLDLQKNIDTAASTTKYLAVAGIFGALAYGLFVLSPVIRASAARKEKSSKQAG